MMNETTFVYIIGRSTGSGICGPVKVGVARDPGVRLAQLQTGNHDKLVVCAAFTTPFRKIAQALESAFHDVFADRRLSGEWFGMSAIEAVEGMCANLRAHINHFPDTTAEEREWYFYLSGGWHAEQKAIQDKYANAWEAQAA